MLIYLRDPYLVSYLVATLIWVTILSTPRWELIKSSYAIFNRTFLGWWLNLHTIVATTKVTDHAVPANGTSWEHGSVWVPFEAIKVIICHMVWWSSFHPSIFFSFHPSSHSTNHHKSIISIHIPKVTTTKMLTALCEGFLLRRFLGGDIPSHMCVTVKRHGGMVILLLMIQWHPEIVLEIHNWDMWHELSFNGKTDVQASNIPLSEESSDFNT